MAENSMENTPAEVQHSEHESHHSDTVTLPYLGTVTVYGGLYTVIFGALAVLTLLEVIIAEFIAPGAFFESGSAPYQAFSSVKIILLMAIAVIKSILVIWFYMHLRSDSRLFLWILLVPLFVVLISVLYLIGLPVQDGLGYF